MADDMSEPPTLETALRTVGDCFVRPDNNSGLDDFGFAPEHRNFASTQPTPKGNMTKAIIRLLQVGCWPDGNQTKVDRESRMQSDGRNVETVNFSTAS
ncbi:unnamed protein product [Protopolystoma xenopodis]|uniref:Uncharacterized protein n=1 Tax=Protopolystoma xenopodis TaxID=117903 RepID=A0A3S5A738_9PLAT|nr:unnamed protein product [Protopolystoma xenopodis]